MSNTKSASQHAVDEFFRALSERDLSIASAVLTKEAVEIIPLAKRLPIHHNGLLEAAEDELNVTKDRVLAIENPFRIDDGATVFVEGRGDLVLKQTGQPYRHIYVFRFSISDGKITEIREYANPVIYAKALGLKVG